MITALLILLGSVFILLSAIGLIRYDDLYSRMQATTKATSFGIFLILIGSSVCFPEPYVYLQALFIILFIYLTAPLGAHSVSKSDKEGRLEE